MDTKYIFQKENFSLSNDELLLDETLFHNANGYIGVRSNYEEGYPTNFKTIRGMYLNGFYDIAPMKQAEKLCGLIEEKQIMVNTADTQGILIEINGESFSLFSGEVLKRTRTLDMLNGTTSRDILWRSPSGLELNIKFTRLTSFYMLPLFLVKVHITPINFSGTIKITSTHIGDVMNFFDPTDPRVAGESHRHIEVKNVIHDGNATILHAETITSKLNFCSAVSHKTKAARTKADGTTKIFEYDVNKGETIEFYKFSILCDSIRYPDYMDECIYLIKTAASLGESYFYDKQSEYLRKFWDNCSIDVDGDDDLTIALRYNLYQLLQSAGKDPNSNIAAKGLSGEGYEGHYFWDTEMYMQPFFTLTERETAKNLIRNRYTILEHAKQNAKILGHKQGAAYPWRTIMGRECSGYFPSGSAQYHISGDIAYAVIAYYLATKDKSLLAECGAEILIETARLWIDIGNYCEGKFHINEVTGPDEYTCLVNNNYYTNALAQYNLNWAVKSVQMLKEMGLADHVLNKTGVTDAELAAFTSAADAMNLPFDEKLGINPQDDSFLQKKMWEAHTVKEEETPLLLHYHPMYLYRHQICKQADTVLAHFILEDTQSLETIEKSFAYYERVTTHDSSLSTCIFSIVASKLGQVDKAYKYFGDSAKMDLFNTHKNTKDGIHTANMGGTYMAIVYGFGGLRIKESGLSLCPVLPEKWNSYNFSFLYEDAKISVKVMRDKTLVTLLHGTEKQITIKGKSYALINEIEVQ